MSYKDDALVIEYNDEDTYVKEVLEGALEVAFERSNVDTHTRDEKQLAWLWEFAQEKLEQAHEAVEMAERAEGEIGGSAWAL